MARTEPAGRAGTREGATGRLTSRLRVLRLRAYRWFFVAQLTSVCGDAVTAPALAFAVLDLTGSAADIGLVLAARATPRVLFMLLGGVLADRLPRHRVMMGADLARMAGQGVIAVLLLTGQAHVWQLVLLQFVHGTASALFMPAVSGLIQQTVPPEHRQAANALRSMSQSAAMIAGPLIATALVVTVGPGWAVALDAATFAVSAACLARLRTAMAGPDGPGDQGDGTLRLRGMGGDLRDGWREFRSRSWVWSLILAASLTNMLYASFTVLGPLISDRDLGGPQAWGAVLAAFGVGAAAGGAAALYLRPRRPLRPAVLAVAFFAAPPLVMSQATAVLPAMVAGFAGGAGLMVFNPLWETVLQREIPASALSRVSAYEWFGSYAAQPAGLALAGPVAALLGPRDTLMAAGLAQLTISLTPLLVRDVRDMRMHGDGHVRR